jgi:hypothetical protein
MITENSLWEKLWEFKLFKVPENEEASIEVSNNHTNEFIFFNIGLNLSLKLYPTVLKMENKEGFINHDYYFYCGIILISLITSLESYLERNFRILASKISVEDLNMETFVKFIKEFRIEKEYFNALKEYNTHEFFLSYVLPERMDLQQKDKVKIAYKLLSIDLPGIADEKQKIWESIFGEKEGYVSLRHETVHLGYPNFVLNYSADDNVVNDKLIFQAALNISKFVYELDKSISMKFPKIDYPNLYAQEVTD